MGCSICWKLAEFATQISLYRSSMTHRDDGGAHQLVAILEIDMLDGLLFASMLRQDDEQSTTTSRK